MNANLLYTNWKKDFDRVLRSLTGKQIFLLFSGGKDSSVALDFLLRAAREYGFSFTSHGGVYPIHRYKDDEIQRLTSYWNERGAHIIWHNVADSDEPLEKSPSPCKECQELRRQKFAKFLRKEVKDWRNLVLIACYSLSDLVSYSVEHILKLFSKDSPPGKKEETRPMETAQRFYPVLKMQEGYTVVRPLVFFDEQTINGYLGETGIPYLSAPCAYRDFRPKRILQEYYEKMGLQFDYHNLFEFMKNVPGFPLAHRYEDMDIETYIDKLF